MCKADNPLVETVCLSIPSLNIKFCLKAFTHEGTNHKELLKRLVKFSMLAFALWI